MRCLHHKPSSTSHIYLSNIIKYIIVWFVQFVLYSLREDIFYILDMTQHKCFILFNISGEQLTGRVYTSYELSLFVHNLKQSLFIFLNIRLILLFDKPDLI